MKKFFLFLALVVLTVGLHAQKAVTVYQDCSRNGDTLNLMPQRVQMVDLGLSVKWANMNVGATTAEDYGNYFAWGEVVPKDTFNWKTYKWCNDGSSYAINKYNIDSMYPIIDNKTQLELADDVAHVNWGDSWRMPTDAEWTELRTNCTWTWTTQNGVNGYKVSATNGNSIFLPAAGWHYDTSLDYVGTKGYYFSSSLGSGSPLFVLGVYFLWNEVRGGSTNRCYGQSVRPVCP